MSGELKKTIRLPQLVALYVGAVLGSGVLLVPGLAAEMAGPASLIAWGVMIVLVLPMGLTMGLLSARHPSAGGVSHFVTLAFGERWGTLTGWFFLLSVPIGVPVNALTASAYLASAFSLGMTGQVVIAAAILAVALLTNWLGMHVTGKVQVAVVVAIVAILVLTFIGSVPHFDGKQMSPFLPHGWWSVGEATSILFWCFIGWEAISHLSEEFVNPERITVKGVLSAVGVIGVLYLMAALATVLTGSYGGANSIAALARVLQMAAGPIGGVLAGIVALFTCMAAAIAYSGAASRVGLALARQGNAPRLFAHMDEKRHTPSGALLFLLCGFAVVLTLFATGVISLKMLIQLPNATFICTYLGGCLAGVKLLKASKWGQRCAWISLVLTIAVYPFLGWMGLYPVVIGVAVMLFYKKKQQEIHSIAS